MATSNSIFSRIFPFNRVSRFFQTGREKEDALEYQQMKNSQGMSQEEFDKSNFLSYENLFNSNQAASYVGVSFENYFANKVQRIMKYREMSLYPEISDALDMLCDEAIVDNPNGDIVSLTIKEELPSNIERQIREEWKYLLTEVFAFNERGWDFFKKWLVEAELYVELILNDKANSIIGIKILPAHSMVPVMENNKIVAFLQTRKEGVVDKNSVEVKGTKEETVMPFDRDQVSYVNYGQSGENVVDVRGYLEPAIRTYNQLKNLEDSLVIYRINKAPLRRLWNVATRRMPKGKSEEYLKGLIQKFRKKVIYNPQTGDIDSAANIQTLTEDYWFLKNEDNSGTEVTTLGESTGFLNEIDDIKLFLGKLNKALKIPKARWEDSKTAGYSTGKNSSEVTREEIKLMKFVERLQRRFKYLILDAFISQLRIKGFDEQYVDLGLYDIEFTKSNLFSEYREMEMTESKINLLTSVDAFIAKPSNNFEGMFAEEYVMKRMLFISDEEYQKNADLIEAAKAKAGVGKKKNVNPPAGIEGQGGAMGGGTIPGEVTPEVPATTEVGAEGTGAPEGVGMQTAMSASESKIYDTVILTEARKYMEKRF